jgi:hypothetical protein
LSDQEATGISGGGENGDVHGNSRRVWFKKEGG